MANKNSSKGKGKYARYRNTEHPINRKAKKRIKHFKNPSNYLVDYNGLIHKVGA